MTKRIKGQKRRQQGGRRTKETEYTLQALSNSRHMEKKDKDCQDTRVKVTDKENEIGDSWKEKETVSIS